MFINTSEHILVILLSIALAILLVLVIVIAIYAIRLLRAANRIADKAEHVARRAEDIGAMLSKATSSAAALKVLKTVFDLANKRRSRK